MSAANLLTNGGMQELTVYALELLEPRATIATGFAPDSPEGINMTNSGKSLRWVAVRGQGAPDWAIYCHWSWRDVEWIKRMGDKVHDRKTIKRLVPCTAEVLKRYRD